MATARLLGPDNFGIYAAGASVVVVATALGCCGLDQLLISGQIAESDFRRGVKSAAALVFVVSSIAVIAWPNLSATSRGVGLIVSFAAAMTVLRLPWTVVPGAHLQFSIRAKRELMLACCVSIATLSLTAGLRSPLAAAAGAAGVGLAIVLLADRDKNSGDATGVAKGVASKVLLRKGLPFAVSGVLYSLYFALDASLMAALRPAAGRGVLSGRVQLRDRRSRGRRRHQQRHHAADTGTPRGHVRQRPPVSPDHCRAGSRLRGRDLWPGAVPRQNSSTAADSPRLSRRYGYSASR